MRTTLIAIRFHAGFVLDLRSVCSTVQVSLHRTDLQIVNGGKERLDEKNRAVAICYLPFSTFGSNYSAAMRFDSTRSGALSSGSVQFYGASNRASICCRGDYLSAYFFGPRDPADTSNDRLDHISPTKEKNRTRLLPRSIDRVIGYCVSLIRCPDRRRRLIAISLGRRCTISTLDLTRSHTFLNFRNFSHLQKKICYDNKLNEI